MSKGSPIITFRIPVDLLTEVDRAINSANWHSKIEPYRRASWIKSAIRQKLDHIKRSKKGKKNGKEKTDESGCSGFPTDV